MQNYVNEDSTSFEMLWKYFHESAVKANSHWMDKCWPTTQTITRHSTRGNTLIWQNTKCLLPLFAVCQCSVHWPLVDELRVWSRS